MAPIEAPNGHGVAFLMLAIGDWWEGLDTIWKVLTGIVGALIIAGSIGWTANDMWSETINAPAIAERADYRSIRDSIRSINNRDRIQVLERAIDLQRSRSDQIEATLERVDRRTLRILCNMSTGNDPECLR